MWPTAMPQLRGDHVVLRAFEDRDVDLVRSAAGDPLIPLITSVPSSGTRADAVAYLARQHDRLATRTGYSFAIADAATDQAVGQIGLWLRNIDQGRVSTGYWIAPRFRGKGYATAALRALSDWALGFDDVARVELSVEPWNQASWHTAERCGYQREGLLRSWQVVGDQRRDMYMYSLTRPMSVGVGHPGESGVTPDAGVFLRPLRPGDAADVLAAFASSADMARQGDVANLSDADRYVANLLDGESHRPWAIVVHGRLVGLVCVSIDAQNRNGWFWYWMHAEARGGGWTGRAAATVANWALTEGGLERLELGHRVHNPASGAVARAAGFVREGTERGKFLIDGERIDVDTYGRLRSDPTPRFEPIEMRVD